MEKSDVYKCVNCQTIVTILKKGDGQLSCCNQKMVDVTPDEGKRLMQQAGMTRPGAP